MLLKKFSCRKEEIFYFILLKPNEMFHQLSMLLNKFNAEKKKKSLLFYLLNQKNCLANPIWRLVILMLEKK